MSTVPEPAGKTQSSGPTTTSSDRARAPRFDASATVTQCPNCGSRAPVGALTCPVCGESLEIKARTIRCRQCGRSASSQLTICPHCGRELTPAAPRWLTWGVPIAAVLLVLGLLALQSNSSNPVPWVGKRFTTAVAWVSSFSAGLDPQLEIVPAAPPGPALAAVSDSSHTEGAVAGSDLGADHDFAVDAIAPASGMLTATQTLAGSQAFSVSESVNGSAAGQSEESAAPTALGVALPVAPTVTLAGPAGAFPPATVPAAATPPAVATSPVVGAVALPNGTAALPTPGVTATSVPPTATPAANSTPAATSTPAVQSYTVQTGDTTLSIALRFGVDLQQLIFANGLTPEEATLIQPGQQLTIPAAAANGEGAPSGSLYTVKDGDTLLGISIRVGMAVDAIMQANDLDEGDVTRIQPGDTLIIPAPTATPGPTSTPTEASTATPVLVSTATPPPPAATAAAPMGLRLSAPQLRGPQDGVTMRCTSDGRLSWEAVSGIKPGDNYRVHLGFVSARDAAGNPRVTWLIEQNVPSTTSQVGLDKSLCNKAPADLGNQWRWYLEVVEIANNAAMPVSPPSDVWGFIWN